MKNYTIYTTNANNTTDNKNKTIFLGEPNYSKTLDNIIASHIIEANPYLKKYFGNTTPKHICGKTSNYTLKNDTPIIGIIDKFFTPSISPIKVDYGKTFDLGNGHTITFFDDEIQIDFDFYPIEEFFGTNIFNMLKPKTKKTIIEIYHKGNLEINLNVA